MKLRSSSLAFAAFSAGIAFTLAATLAPSLGSAAPAVTPTPAPIATPSPNVETQLDATDLSPAVTYYGKMISKLKRPITVYNWSDTADKGEDNPGYLYNGRAGADTFWRQYGKRNQSRGSMYGAGLYAAVDPAVTAGYGGGATTARVLVIRLKEGTRILDLPKIASTTLQLPEQVSKLLSKFQCPPQASPDGLFQYGGQSLTDDCVAFVRRIFRDKLEIDAFAYGYSSMGSKDCTGDPMLTSRAFVFMRDTTIDPSEYFFMTSSSSKNFDLRLLVQTTLIQIYDLQIAQWGRDMMTVWRSVLVTYLTEHPDDELKSTTSTCEGNQCKVAAKFCNPQGTCTDLALGSYPRPGGPLITKEEAQSKSSLGLFWADLEGKPKATTTTYLRNTMFGCDGTLPYQDEN